MASASPSDRRCAVTRASSSASASTRSAAASRTVRRNGVTWANADSSAITSRYAGTMPPKKSFTNAETTSPASNSGPHSTTSTPAASIRSTAARQTARISVSGAVPWMLGAHSTREGAGGSSSAARKLEGAGSSERRSPGAGPATTSRARATSRMRRAIGPTVDRSAAPIGAGPDGTRPWVGL